MKPKALQLAALVLALCHSGVGWGESQAEARRWLERMIQAAQTLNYEGTFVYAQGQSLEAMHIIHSTGSDGERQRMFSLNGAVREVVVADNRVICVLPRQTVAFNGAYYNRSPFPISLPRELGALEHHYGFKVLGKDRIAGMSTRVIAIEPRDRLRFGYRLWLEDETGMVLRSVLLDEEGRVVEQLMFTSLEVKPRIDPARLLPSAPISAAAGPGQPGGENVVDSPWVLSRPPDGFSQVMHNRFSAAASRHSTEHILFTDGLATVSVFLERLDGAEPLLEGASRMGAMNAFGMVLEDHQVVVVGEVPGATVEMIAKALEYAPAAAALGDAAE